MGKDPLETLHFQIYRFESGSLQRLDHGNFKKETPSTITSSFEATISTSNKNFSSILIFSKINLFPMSYLDVEAKKGDAEGNSQLQLSLSFDYRRSLFKSPEFKKSLKYSVRSNGTASIYKLLREENVEYSNGEQTLIKRIFKESKLHQCKLGNVKAAKLITEISNKKFLCIKPVKLPKDAKPSCTLNDFEDLAVVMKPETIVYAQNSVLFYTHTTKSGSQFCSDGSMVYYVKFEFDNLLVRALDRIGDVLNGIHTTAGISLGRYYGSHKLARNLVV